MGVNLSKIVQNVMTTVENSVDNTVRFVDYVHVTGAPTYNPTTGGQTVPSTTYEDVRAVLTRFRDRQIDGAAIRQNDLKLLVAKLDLNITPTKADYVNIAGSRWNVVEIMSDPANALHTLQLRRP